MSREQLEKQLQELTALHDMLDVDVYVAKDMWEQMVSSSPARKHKLGYSDTSSTTFAQTDPHLHEKVLSVLNATHSFPPTYKKKLAPVKPKIPFTEEGEIDPALVDDLKVLFSSDDVRKTESVGPLEALNKRSAAYPNFVVLETLGAETSTDVNRQIMGAVEEQPSVAELEAQIARAQHLIRHFKAETNKNELLVERLEPTNEMMSRSLYAKVVETEKRMEFEQTAGEEKLVEMVEQINNNERKKADLEKKIAVMQRYVEKNCVPFSLPIEQIVPAEDGEGEVIVTVDMAKHLSEHEKMMSVQDLLDIVKKQEECVRDLRREADQKKTDYSRQMRRVNARLDAVTKELKELQDTAWLRFEVTMERENQRRLQKKQSFLFGPTLRKSKSKGILKRGGSPTASEASLNSPTHHFGKKEEPVAKSTKTPAEEEEEELARVRSVALLSLDDKTAERRYLREKRWEEERIAINKRELNSLLQNEERSRTLLWEIFLDSLKVMKTDMHVARLDVIALAKKIRKRKELAGVSSSQSLQPTATTTAVVAEDMLRGNSPSPPTCNPAPSARSPRSQTEEY